ncbi:jouberin-like isoform X2 [Symsagittifera roscoffensis]|uniref:jouberin-like isoform X2 n=1 Tax=Symsagittifera roscoffensis TaxID=84072 RepID=UPI00307CAFD7
MAPSEDGDVADALRSTYQSSLTGKRKNNEEIEMLEKIKEGTSLRKEKDTFAESNLMKSTVGKTKTRKKTGERKSETNSGFESNSEKLETEQRAVKTTEAEGEVEPHTEVKKKKPLKKKQNTEISQSTEPLAGEKSKDEVENELHADGTEARGEAKPKNKKKKKLPTAAESGETALPVVPRIQTSFDDERVLGVTIHRTDRLKQHKYVTSPLVRVHVMDANTGHYVKKEDSKRTLRLPHEPGYEALEFHPPLCTGAFDFKKRQSLIPRWEQQLFIDERYLYFLENKTNVSQGEAAAPHSPSPNTVVLFELLNYVDTTGMKEVPKGRSSNWMRIAWAFLQLVGGNRALNVEKKVRLQLFHPQKQFTSSEEIKQDTSDGREMINWVRMRNVKYPGTIYVTVKGTHVKAAQMPSKTIGRLTEAESDVHDEDDKLSSDPPEWSRLPGQICKVPNKQLKSLKAGKTGCSIVRFSNEGRKLACACGDKNGYSIQIYDIPSCKSLGQFSGHFSLIYDLCWSRADNELVSSSQDGSVQCWNVDSMKREAVCVMNHPGYVYCAKYHPVMSHVVVSGCYDNVIRVWRTDAALHDKNAVLLKELHSHNGFVNCLCFDSSGTTMYSCDSVGTVITWRVTLPSSMNLIAHTGAAGEQDYQNSSSGGGLQFLPERIFTDPEINGVPLSVVQLHGSGKRLLLQCKDNTVRVLDLRLNIIMARYAGAINFKDHIRSTFSPCGTYIYASSEDCTAVVWNTDTCETVCHYRDLGFTASISDICYHPFENLVAFCAIGPNQPIVLFSYDCNRPDRTFYDANAPGAFGGTTDFELRAVTPAPSAPNTPRNRSFRAKSPLLSSHAFYGPGKYPSSEGSIGLTASTKADLMVKSSRELASEIIHSVKMDHVSRTINASIVSDGNDLNMSQSRARANRRRMKQARMSDAGSLAGDLTNRSSLLSATAAAQEQDPMSNSPGGSTLNVNTSPRPTLRTSDMVKQLDREMPGARMTMLIQSEKPKFMLSAKTGISQWARAIGDYSAERSDELSVSKGVLVKVVLKDNDRWWLAQLHNAAQGYLPSSCLELITESDAQAISMLENEPRRKISQATAPPSSAGDLSSKPADTFSETSSQPESSKIPDDDDELQTLPIAKARTRRGKMKKETAENTIGEGASEDALEMNKIEEILSQQSKDDSTDLIAEELL